MTGMAALAVALIAAIIAVPLSIPTYVFSEKDVAEIARTAIAQGAGNTSKIVEIVVDLTRQKYPQWIIDNPEWVFNNAGGAMGSMMVLHVSLSEYLIIFGTAIGTEGHTGRFLADDWFAILAGEQWAYPAGALEKEVYKPGDQQHLPFGHAKAYRCPNECWALEYARGNIPSMLPFGLFDTFFSTLDLQTLLDTLRISTLSMFSNIVKGKI